MSEVMGKCVIQAETTNGSLVEWSGDTLSWSLDSDYIVNYEPTSFTYTHGSAGNDTLEDDLERLTSGSKKESKRMLYEVFIVDPELEEVVYHTYKVATSATGAERKVLTSIQLDKDVEDLDFITRKIGDVRSKKEVQEVKVVE